MGRAGDFGHFVQATSKNDTESTLNAPGALVRTRFRKEDRSRFQWRVFEKASRVAGYGPREAVRTGPGDPGIHNLYIAIGVCQSECLESIEIRD